MGDVPRQSDGALDLLHEREVGAAEIMSASIYDVPKRSWSCFWMSVNMCLHELVGEVGEEACRRLDGAALPQGRQHLGDASDIGVHEKPAMAHTYAVVTPRHAARNMPP